MKRILYLLAAAALMIPAACDPIDKPDPGKDVVLPAPATKEVAQKIQFSGKAKPTIEGPAGTKIEVYAVEFTEASRAIITTSAKVAFSAVPDLTKANSSIAYLAAAFTVNGSTFAIENFGSITVNGSNVSITFKDGTTFSGSATISPSATSSVLQSNAARTWIVDNSVLEINDKGSVVKNTFSGCNLENYAKFAADNGAKGIKVSDFKGYSVKEIMLTGSNSFVISFTGADSFGGTYTLKDDGSFSCKLDEGNSFFNESASGSIEFTEAGKMVFLLKATIEGVSGSVKLVCAEVK